MKSHQTRTYCHAFFVGPPCLTAVIADARQQSLEASGEPDLDITVPESDSGIRQGRKTFLSTPF